MIRTVHIPTAVSRMGCAPGAGCCSDCGGHQLTGTHSNRITTPGEGARNSALRAHLGDLPEDPGLDQAVADWTATNISAADQTALNALLLNGHSAAPIAATGPSKDVLTFIGVGIGFIVLLELFSRRR